MKYVDEYRDPEAAREIVAAIRRRVTQPWTLMEVCGGQTHTILKTGIQDLLPGEITLVHGPGCPVCVTPLGLIDQAIAIASRREVIFCSFGDMLRVPGSTSSLNDARAEGADVRVVYSPLDALKLARANPNRKVVFFAIGFETTAPANAMAVWQADREGIGNFSILAANVLVPPAMRAILDAPGCKVQGFLAPGHVCTGVGMEEYESIAARYHFPIVVTGFEPLDLLEGIRMTISQLETGHAELENQYGRVVRREGNIPARRLMDDVFEVVSRRWRGIGEVPASGLCLRARFRRFDAATGYALPADEVAEPAECIAGFVLQGLRKPRECPAFGTRCTPEHPLGAPMVSSEGACAAYYRYGRKKQ